jgi:PAS domain S-box-containing protein
MGMELLRSGLADVLGIVFSLPPSFESSTARQFVITKDSLTERDSIILAMLNSRGHETVCYCICDPAQTDCPIIFASDGFCAFTGYNFDEIEGRNCRFLQGKETQSSDVDRIRQAIKQEREVSVNLLNYRKDGSTFINEFFLSPLRNDAGKVVYYIGVQCSVPAAGPGQAPKNSGWVYSQGLHA